MDKNNIKAKLKKLYAPSNILISSLEMSDIVYITKLSLPCMCQFRLDVQVFSTKEKAEEYVINKLSSAVCGMADLIAKEGLNSYEVYRLLSNQEVDESHECNWFSIEGKELI